MLKSLSIHNYAIIASLELEFSGQLSIITGETGAGKSILLGALSLILGQRADTQVLFDKTKKCIVEGSLSIGDYQLEEFFRQEELDYEETTIIRREISPAGKSRAFINDTPVTLHTLKALSDQLIDLHAQHETLELNDLIFQAKVIDALAQHEADLANYKEAYKRYAQTLNRLEALLAAQQKLTGDLDYYQFQYDELEQATLQADEQEELEQQQYTLQHAEEIQRSILQAIQLLSESDQAATGQLQEAISQLEGLIRHSDEIGALSGRLSSALIDIRDVATELERMESQTSFDETAIEEIQDRLNLIYKLQKKHQVDSVTALLQIQTDLEQKLQHSDTSAREIEALQQQVKEMITRLLDLAMKISGQRKAVIEPFEKQVAELLAAVGMPNSRLRVQFDQLPDDTFNASGIDKIRFLFSANKGSELKDIKKIASGGELSRLMLCIKSLVAGSTALPTLIFDEVDTGVSGETAAQVGQILQKLSNNHQVICITHLPQIASKGSCHYFVYKETSGQNTFTRIKKLSDPERVTEIAKMLSGDQPSEAAIENAKELLMASA